MHGLVVELLIDYYPSTIVQMDHMVIVYLTQIHIGVHMKWLQSYNLWEYAFIEGDSSSESINFHQLTGDLFTMPAGPVGFSLFLEDNQTDYEIDPSQAYDDDRVWGRSTTEGGGERTEHLIQ